MDGQRNARVLGDRHNLLQKLLQVSPEFIGWRDYRGPFAVRYQALDDRQLQPE